MNKETIKFLAKVRPLGIYRTRNWTGINCEYTYFPKKGVRLGGEEEIEIFLLEDGMTMATSRVTTEKDVERTFLGYMELEEVMDSFKKDDILKSLINLTLKKKEQHLLQVERIDKIKASLQHSFQEIVR